MGTPSKPRELKTDNSIIPQLRVEEMLCFVVQIRINKLFINNQNNII